MHGLSVLRSDVSTNYILHTHSTLWFFVSAVGKSDEKKSFSSFSEQLNVPTCVCACTEWVKQRNQSTYFPNLEKNNLHERVMQIKPVNVKKYKEIYFCPVCMFDGNQWLSCLLAI